MAFVPPDIRTKISVSVELSDVWDARTQRPGSYALHHSALSHTVSSSSPAASIITMY